jgi:hypothetical protein
MVKLQDLVKQYPAVDATMAKIFDVVKKQPHLMRIWGNNQYFEIRFGNQGMFPFNCMIEPNGTVYYSEGMYNTTGWNVLTFWCGAYSGGRTHGLQIDNLIGNEKLPNMLVAHTNTLDKLLITSDGYGYIADNDYLNRIKDNRSK